MTALLRRSLRYYWRTNVAVVAGVAAAVSVLAGALLVGASVRASLRELVEARLGRTETVIASTGLFRDKLADSFADATPLLSLEGLVIHQLSGRRATGVAVYGVDDRFWRFHGVDRKGPIAREVYASPGLAAELAAAERDTLLVRLQLPTDIPLESLHGRKDETAARTIRSSLRLVLPEGRLGEFSLKPQQGAVRAVFLSLVRLQEELEQPGKANVILLAGARDTEKRLRDVWTLEDAGIRVREVEGGMQLETASGVIPDALAAEVKGETMPLLTYLANSIRARGRSIPYSLVTALDLSRLPAAGRAASSEAIVLNQWAAADLAVKPGDPIELEYYYWTGDNRLETRAEKFVLAAVTPIEGVAADRRLAPDYPGITDADDVNNWDPPFPMNLKLIRPKDEDYWDRYRTTPKAFVSLETGQRLWSSRFGKLTAIRATRLPDLRASLDPLTLGFTVTPVRDQNLGASRGATDFGEYFLYFSFFLVVSALLLTGLFFRLGIEQRAREIGLLDAVGFPPRQVFRLFASEGLALAAAGGLLGAAGALAYAAVIVLGLRTWWSDAVGTNAIRLAPSGSSLAIGALAGITTAFVAIALTLRHLRRSSTRSLLAGGNAPGGRAAWAGLIAAALGIVLLIVLPQAGGFFAAGALLLVAMLCWMRAAWQRGALWGVSGTGLSAVVRMGFRNGAHRPGRSVLCCALIASATFLIVSVEAFRRHGVTDVRERKSGSGGYALVAESQLPIIGSEAVGEVRSGLSYVPLRLRPGDDASCLNLYQPRNPRILAAPPGLAREGRFAFSSGDWTALDSVQPDGAVPAIADANSLAYVLHRKIGDTFEIATGSGGTVTLRFVAALADSIFQSEILIAEKDFLRLFPDQQGYRVFLIDAAPGAEAELTANLEERFGDYGFDAVSTAARLAAFHRVENTYLSTFQTLGALGLLLGTIGLAALLVRNVLERRREMALLTAIGYSARRLGVIVLVEHAMLLAAGLVMGALAAALAVAPALAARAGGGVPVTSLVIMLAAVLAVGLAATVAATFAALRLPLLPALREGG